MWLWQVCVGMVLFLVAQSPAGGQELNGALSQATPAAQIEVVKGPDVASGVERFPASVENRYREATATEAAEIRALLALPDIFVISAHRPRDEALRNRFPEVKDLAATTYYEAMTHSGQEKCMPAGAFDNAASVEKFAEWVADYIRSGWLTIGGRNQVLKVKEWHLSDGPKTGTAVIKMISEVYDDTGGGTSFFEGQAHVELDKTSRKIQVYTWGSIYYVSGK